MKPFITSMMALMVLAAPGLVAQPSYDPFLAQAASHRLMTAARTLPADRLAAEIRHFATDKSLPAVARRIALHQLIVGLRDEPESPAAHAALDQIAILPVPALEPHPESAAVLHDPSGLLPAIAGTRKAWRWHRFHRRALADLQSGSLAFAREMAGQPDAVALAASASAIRSLGNAAHSAAPQLPVDQLAKLVSDEPRLAELSGAAFEISGDHRLLQQVIDAGQTALAARLIHQADQWLEPDTAVELWALYVDHEQLAPAAIAGLGRHPGTRSLQILSDLLGDPQLGVAAAHSLRGFTAPWAIEALEQMRTHHQAPVRNRIARILEQMP